MGTSKYEVAQKRINEKRKFRKHFLVFILVNTFLAVVNLFLSNTNDLWFLYSLFGWGIGITMQYYNVYIQPEWEEKEFKKEVNRLEGHARSIFTEEGRLELDDFLPEKEKELAKKWKDTDLV